MGRTKFSELRKEVEVRPGAKERHAGKACTDPFGDAPLSYVTPNADSQASWRGDSK